MAHCSYSNGAHLFNMMDKLVGKHKTFGAFWLLKVDWTCQTQMQQNFLVAVSQVTPSKHANQQKVWCWGFDGIRQVDFYQKPLVGHPC